jgi:hypothetical protein
MTASTTNILFSGRVRKTTKANSSSSISRRQRQHRLEANGSQRPIPAPGRVSARRVIEQGLSKVNNNQFFEYFKIGRSGSPSPGLEPTAVPLLKQKASEKGMNWVKKRNGIIVYLNNKVQEMLINNFGGWARSNLLGTTDPKTLFQKFPDKDIAVLLRYKRFFNQARVESDNDFRESGRQFTDIRSVGLPETNKAMGYSAIRKEDVGSTEQMNAALDKEEQDLKNRGMVTFRPRWTRVGLIQPNPTLYAASPALMKPLIRSRENQQLLQKAGWLDPHFDTMSDEAQTEHLLKKVALNVAKKGSPLHGLIAKFFSSKS